MISFNELICDLIRCNLYDLNTDVMVSYLYNGLVSSN